MHDAAPGRHDPEVAKRFLPPAEEQVALTVALVLAFDIRRVRLRRSEDVDLHGVVDHEIGRDERVDALRIAAEARDRRAHRREVDDRRHAGEVLQDDARGQKRYLARREREGVFVGGKAERVVAQHVLEQDADGVRQLRERAVALPLQGVETVVADAAAGGRHRRVAAERVDLRHHVTSAIRKVPGAGRSCHGGDGRMFFASAREPRRMRAPGVPNVSAARR